MNNFQKISKREYKELLDKASFKTFFHKIEWHEFLEKEFKWLKFEYYLYRPASPAGGNKTIFPVARVGRKLISLPFCEYGGPLGDFEEKDILKEFKNIKVKVHPQIMRESRSPTLGRDSSISTHWLELKNKTEKDLLSSFRKTLRHSIKNAQNSGLKIRKCENEKELKKFYNLYVANLKRKKTVPYPYSAIKFLFNQPETEIWLALHKDKIIAGDLFLHYDSFVHYFLSASDYKYKKLGASYLILWEKIKSLVNKDIIFDFGAAPKGSALEIFKKGWRGKEYPILQIGIKRTEELLRSSKLRNVWKLLPNWLIKIISPYFIKYRI